MPIDGELISVDIFRFEFVLLLQYRSGCYFGARWQCQNHLKPAIRQNTSAFMKTVGWMRVCGGRGGGRGGWGGLLGGWVGGREGGWAR